MAKKNTVVSEAGMDASVGNSGTEEIVEDGAETVAVADPAAEVAAVAADTAEIVEAAQPTPTHRITAAPAIGFYRAGHHWPREGLQVYRSDFTDEQWAALEAEPMLTVAPL